MSGENLAHLVLSVSIVVCNKHRRHPQWGTHAQTQWGTHAQTKHENEEEQGLLGWCGENIGGVPQATSVGAGHAEAEVGYYP